MKSLVMNDAASPFFVDAAHTTDCLQQTYAKVRNYISSAPSFSALSPYL
jgi:hypothetical protein